MIPNVCVYLLYILHLNNDYYNYSLDGHRPLSDVSHSSLTGFEILYKWEGEQVIFITNNFTFYVIHISYRRMI